MAQARLVLFLLAFSLSAATASADPTEPCVDDDAKWASFGSTCAKMKWQCDVPGYNVLVQRWCPRSCGLCSPTPTDDVATDDVVAFMGYEANSLDLTMVRKDSGNSTAHADGSSLKLVANASAPNTSTVEVTVHAQNGSSHLKLVANASALNSSMVEVMVHTQNGPPTNSSSIAGLNSTYIEENGTILHESETFQITQITQEPQKWEITLPFKDAVVDVFSKGSFATPRAIWSPDQEHFVFEFPNRSDVGNASEEDNVSSKALAAEGIANAQALQDDEDNRCPDGYEKAVGHIYGGDQYGRGYDLFAPTIKQCAHWCTQTPGCGSIEYSRRRKRCFRNSQTRPTDLQDRRDYILCRRAPCPSLLTEESCVGPSVTPGWLSEEIKLRPGSYCIWSAGKCQAPMTCTYEDCFLPDGGLPGMDLPPSKTLWISRAGLMSTMAQKIGF